jgi:hypothetical protein
MNKMWRMLLKGKAGEHAVISALLGYISEEKVSLNIYPPVVDFAGVDFIICDLRSGKAHFTAVAIQCRGKIALRGGDTSVANLVTLYSSVCVFAVCPALGVVVASCDQIRSALENHQSSISLSDCLALNDWLGLGT